MGQPHPKPIAGASGLGFCGNKKHGDNQAGAARRCRACPRLYRKLATVGTSDTQVSYNQLVTMAEEEGFEPPVEFPLLRFSRPPPSTARPFLHLDST